MSAEDKRSGSEQSETPDRDVAGSRGSEVGEEEIREAHESGQPVAEIQEQVEQAEAEKSRKFGTFGGVFTPTLLTILGVIMFLREGWVVGNAGLGGAWLIIALSFFITGCTALSMACFVTNIRVGGGGAFSMISQSLGLEVGGAIGVPLYISQALAVCMYVFGFRAGWLWVFPDHDPLFIDLAVFATVFAITLISASLAVKVQYLIMAVILASLVSIAVAAATGSMQHPVTWWGDFPGDREGGFAGATFWIVFAVFFPASTGIMAGANMSGELRNPQKSIPRGTMAAIGISFVVYMALAYWLMRSATVEELLNNYTVMIDKAFWGPVVLAGLLAATFSSALVSFVGAPRILQALSEHRIVPGSGLLSKRARGEPLYAILLTSVIVVLALMLRDLNAIAPLITMFFLVTYAAINLIVLIEQSLGLVSFRPLLQIPRFVPSIGLVGCLTAMFIINPVMSLVAMIVIGMIYFVLLKRQLEAPFGDVRSGIFLAAAEWAAKKVKMMEGSTERVWKPHLLVPTDEANKLYGIHRLVYDLAHPTGSVKLLGLRPDDSWKELREELEEPKRSLQEEGIFCSASAMRADDFAQGIRQGMEALSGSMFRPNVLFLTLPHDPELQDRLEPLREEAGLLNLGVALYAHHEDAGLGRRQKINMWIHDHGPDWDIQMRFANLDMSLLLAYRLTNSWDADMTLIVTVEDEKDKPKAEEFLAQLSQAARLPGDTEILVAEGDFGRFSSRAPRADLNIFPLGDKLDVEFIRAMRERTGASCLFTQDGGSESALA